MTKIQEAPIAGKVVDQNDKCTPVWTEYFASITQGDVGTGWSPVFTNLTTVGTPTITGVYYENQGFTDFYIKIVPGTNTSSVIGSTFVPLPFAVTADTIAGVVTGQSGGVGVVNAASQTVYTPSWTNVPSPVTISGRVRSV